MPLKTKARALTKRPSDLFVGRTLALDILDRLRRDIVACVLKPGTRLRFDQLRTIYDASVTTLREALVKLAAEGLVVSEGQRGFLVAPASVQDLLDLTRVRMLIEKEVITRSLVMAKEEWELQVLAAFQGLSRVESRFDGTQRSSDPHWSAAHSKFHEALASACDSPILLEVRKVLYTRADRYRRLSARYTPESADKVDEHRPILEACISRNVPLAVRLLENHIQHTTQNVLDYAPGFAAPNIDGVLSRSDYQPRPE